VEPATIPHAHDPAALADDAHAAACAESSRRGDLRISAAGERGRDGAPVAYLLTAIFVLAGLGGTALGWWLALASGAL
jgi:hypothetical protein